MKSSRRSLFVSFLVVMMSAAIITTTSKANAQTLLQSIFSQDPDWTYGLSDPRGPLAWGDIRSFDAQGQQQRKYPLCRSTSSTASSTVAATTTTRQSPVNIVRSALHPGFQQLSRQWSAVENATFFNDGRVLLMHFPAVESGIRYTDTSNSAHALLPASEVADSTQSLQLAAIIFRSTSEHTYGGSYADAELQLVHVSGSTGKVKMIIGVRILAASPYSAHAALGKLLQRAPTAAEGSRAFQVNDFTVGDLLPCEACYTTYVGSVTMPPCTEGVRWMVLREALVVSVPQLEQLRALLGLSTVASSSAAAVNTANVRPVQLLQRVAYRYAPTTSSTSAIDRSIAENDIEGSCGGVSFGTRIVDVPRRGLSVVALLFGIASCALAVGVAYLHFWRTKMAATGEGQLAMSAGSPRLRHHKSVARMSK